MQGASVQPIGANSWLRVGMICGFLGSITYTLAVFVPLPFRIDYLIFFIVGPFIIAGMYAIFQYLRTGRDSIALQLGTLFMVCAGIAITMMATMQGFIRGHYREARAGVEKEEEIDAVRQIFLAVDSTQQGLDMAFDVFVSTGTFLFALALVRQPRYGAWYGIPGMAVGALGLFLNALSFPIVNAGEAGYIDAAPFFGTFYGVLSVKFLWEWIQVERGKLQLPAQEPSHL